jgi:hypothetical protein
LPCSTSRHCERDDTELPDYDRSLVVRTDFSDDAAWEQVCQAIQEPQTGRRFQAHVECISDDECSGLAPDAVASVLPVGSQRPFVFVADAQAISQPGHPVLVVDRLDEPGRGFRVIPAQAWSVENNIRLANMAFADLANSVDPDGTFRGFPGLLCDP